MDSIENAVKNFCEGRACSQAILAEYGERFALDRGTALKLAAGFAGGMCFGNTCGAVTGAYMVLGLKFSGPNCENKEGRQNVYRAIRQFTERFEAMHGSTRCEILLGCNIGTPEGMQKAKDENKFKTACPEYVKSSAKILEGML